MERWNVPSIPQTLLGSRRMSLLALASGVTPPTYHVWATPPCDQGSRSEMQTQFQYHPGFGSEISSEALPDALPKGQVR